MSPWVARVVAGIVCVSALVSASRAWRSAALRGPDRVTALEAEFRMLAGYAPPSGTIGYLPHADEPDSTDHTLDYYVAQYAFAPRLVVRRTDLEFLIVAPDAIRPGRDDELAGFVPVATSWDGHRLYRRRQR